jgi:peptide/nickel transport system substrate-binding protein
MDYEAFINEILKGQGIKIPTAVLKGLLGFTEELPLYELNLQKAEDYFKSAYGGRLWNTGFKATMVYNIGNDTRRAAAEILRDNLAQINPRFQLEVRGIQWPTYLDDLENHRLPVYILGFSMDFPDPHNFVFNRYHSEGNTGKDLGKLYEDFANLPRPEFSGRSLNKMIEDAAVETDPVKREQMYIDIQEFIIYYTPNFPLAQTLTNKVTRSWLKGFIYNPMWSGDYYYNYTKVE